jgi:hypothetical protein
LLSSLRPWRYPRKTVKVRWGFIAAFEDVKTSLMTEEKSFDGRMK